MGNFSTQPHVATGTPPTRRLSLIESAIHSSSFRLGRIQNSLRRLGMRMSRRGSTSTNTETVPRIANYRNIFNFRSPSRPTLDDLHEPITMRPNVMPLFNSKASKFEKQNYYIASKSGGWQGCPRTCWSQVWLDRGRAHPQHVEYLGCNAFSPHFVGCSSLRNL